MSITLPRDYLPPTLAEVVARIEAARNDLAAARNELAGGGTRAVLSRPN